LIHFYKRVREHTMPLTHSKSCSLITDKQHAEFICKFCSGMKFKSSSMFLAHLSTNHVTVEGGSYTCRYGQNSICTACPAVGISKEDYAEHVTKHHINRDKVKFTNNNNNLDFWDVLSSSVNLPAVLNDPGKGKQKDFFTRTWGAEFIDTSILPPSPFVCEIPPQSFQRYVRKMQKLNLKHPRQPLSLPRLTRSLSVSSSSNPPSFKPPSSVQNLDIPSIFLCDNFDLSNPTTFNSIFSFLDETLNHKIRANPFQIETHEAKLVESSGQLLQEKLQHYIDQVEVNIAGQVANKSHQFFEVLNHHNVLMSQLLSLINVVKSVRNRLSDVEGGVTVALKVSQLALRKQNLESVLTTLKTVETLHKTQPTIQLLISRQEYAGALDLMETSKDIINTESLDIDSLKYLPRQLDELKDATEKILLSDFKAMVEGAMNKEAEDSKSSLENFSNNNIDDCALGPTVSGLLRLQAFSFLEFLEQQEVKAVKETIKGVILSTLSLNEDTTLTALVANFAVIASTEKWVDLLDMLCGSLIVVLRRIHLIHEIVKYEIDELSKSKDDNYHQLSEETVKRFTSLVHELMINICEQVHERLGKMVTVRSRPAAIKQVTPRELARVDSLVSRMVAETEDMCGKTCAGLSLSYQGQAILYMQVVQEKAKEKIIKQMENEKWKKSVINIEEITKLHEILSGRMVEMDVVNNGDVEVIEVIIDGEKHIFVDSVISLLEVLSDYCHLADHIPKAKTEVGLKIAELLKLFNSRTCQLVLGAGAVSIAGLKTITIRNLGVTLRSLNLVAKILPVVRQHLLNPSKDLTEKQRVNLAKHFDSADKDYREHQGEIERKIIQIVDDALTQQLDNWQLQPPVPSPSFQSIGKQLTKFYEAIHDILPPTKISNIFKTIHLTFLSRVSDKLEAGEGIADTSPTRGLVMSELIFYRENLKYLDVVPEEMLSNDALAVVWV